MNLKIIKYEKSYEKEWDEFIEKESINGTFLQQWKFLNYHEEGRFEDCSIIVLDKDKIVAVCPACVVVEQGKKVFYSHLGSTYGGLIIAKEMLRVEKIKVLVEVFEEYLRRQGFYKCVLKPTMDILCSYPQDVLEFFTYLNGYKEWKELNIYIDYEKFDSVDILSNFSKMKKRNVKKCIKSGFEVRKLISKKEIGEFHRILALNLKKYNRNPIHTVDELCELTRKLENQIEFYGAFIDNQMMAGTMVFLFDNVKCAHTQYLASDPEYNYLNPMAFIYYKMAEIYSERKYRYLSWGIATEHLGEEINYGLANNKEEYGSLHCINHIYEKIIGE